MWGGRVLPKREQNPAPGRPVRWPMTYAVLPALYAHARTLLGALALTNTPFARARTHSLERSQLRTQRRTARLGQESPAVGQWSQPG